MLALYKSKSGLLRPCEIIAIECFGIDEAEDNLLIKFTRCNKTKWCCRELVVEYDEDLIDTEW